jgi:hypothetical protein
MGCSDFFHGAEHYREQVVSPLLAAGTSVKTYFHTYVDTDCPQRDERLVRELDPARYEFQQKRLPRIVDSLIRVLELVLQDEQEIDAVVMTRFDLRYRVPITSLNVDWNATNLAFHDVSPMWKARQSVSDLLFILPVKHVRPLIQSLNVSAGRPGLKSGGPGHDMYNAFVRIVGSTALRFIDDSPGGATSASSPNQASTFVALSRACGADFHTCPAQ